MSRIPIPASAATAPAAATPLLQAVKDRLGSVPNLFRLTATGPAALKGYLGLNDALDKGVLDGPTRERIALTVAQINGCGYCLAAHSYLARNVAKLAEDEIAANREGYSTDARANAAVRFAAEVTRARGSVTDGEFAAVRAAGFSDAEIVEIVAHVALNTFTNYINEVFKTDIDFPVVPVKHAA